MSKSYTTLLLTIFVNLATTTDQDASISPQQDTPWQTPSDTQLTNPDLFDPHDLTSSNYHTVRIVHAALMSTIWLILFPIGAVIIRAMNNPLLVWVHAAIQMVAFWIFVAAAGMGIWMGRQIGQLHTYHPVIGMILLALLAVQPATEIMNHRFYHRHPKVIVTAHVHLWLGRVLLAVGVIQGGLGFVFVASFPKAVVEVWPRVAYGVVALVAYVMYLAVGVVWPELRGQGRKRNGSETGEGGRVEDVMGAGDCGGGGGGGMDMTGIGVDYVHGRGLAGF